MELGVVEEGLREREEREREREREKCVCVCADLAVFFSCSNLTV